jgi:hypothetical protein
MKLWIERLIPNPVRKISVERHLDKPLTKIRCKMRPLLNGLDNAFEANDAVRRGRWVENTHRANVHWRILCLEEQKGCVESAYLLHAGSCN